MSATRGLYELKDGTFVRTQAEIPKGEPTNKVEIPVGSQELCEYLNQLIARERSQAAVTPADMLVGHPDEAPSQPEATPPPPPPPPAAPSSDHAAMRRKLAQDLRGMEVEAIEQRILEMKGPSFARVMVASIERFGVLGKDAWDGVRGFLDMHGQQFGPYDRGLKLLALSQVAALDEPKREPQSYKDLAKT